MLEKAFIISFIVMFIWATLLKGMIFGFVRAYLETRISEYWQQPIFDCPVCMVPYYGSVAYWLLVWSAKWNGDWIEWIVVVFAAAGINQVFLKLFPHDNQKMTLMAEEINPDKKE